MKQDQFFKTTFPYEFSLKVSSVLYELLKLVKQIKPLRFYVEML